MIRDYDHRFKMVLVGDASVGKSCLIERFVYNTFDCRINSGIGVEFAGKRVTLDGKVLSLKIWDPFGGGDGFKGLEPRYYRGTHGIVCIYEVSNRASFENVEIWLSDIEQKANSQIQKLLVGNKVDLEERREVEYASGKELAEKLKIPFIETSAKDSTNVEVAFLTLISQIKDQIETESAGALDHGYSVTPSRKTIIDNEWRWSSCQIV